VPAIRKLRDEAELAQSQAAFEAVFRTADPFDHPFQDEVEARDLLYPVGFRLDEKEFHAVAEAAGKLGEGRAFISEVEGYSGSRWATRNHWEIDLGTYPYPQLASQGFIDVMENAIYSTAGNWGLLISHEQHALAGGAPLFVSSLRRKLDRDHMSDFLSFWRENLERFQSDLSWLAPLLEHLYGSGEAARLLRKTRLPNLYNF
jgi:hypothetical protein